MSAFLHDDFTGTGAIGTPNWVKNSYDPLSEGLSKYVQSGGFVGASATPTTFAMYNGTPPSADYYVEGSVRFAAAANAQSVELGLRGTNTTHSISGYYAELFWVDATHMGAQIWSQGGGAGQLNGSGVISYAVADPTNFIARFEIAGSTLKFSLNGTQVWTGTEATFSSGVPWMFFNYGASATDVRLDYFEAGTSIVPAFWTDYIKTTEVDA